MFQIQISGLEESLRSIRHIPDGINRAGTRAIKKSLVKAKEQAKTSFQSVYTYKKKLSGSSERVSGLHGELGFGDKTTFRDEFAYRPTAPLKGQRGKYISSEVKRGSSETLGKAFKTPRRKPLFERTGARRYPIRRIKGPSLGEMVADAAVSRPVVRSIENYLPVYLSQEAAALLG